jgi:hypothetical protein
MARWGLGSLAVLLVAAAAAPALAAPGLSARDARERARQVLETRASPTEVADLDCERRSESRFDCTVVFFTETAGWRGAVTVWNTQSVTRYRARLVRTNLRCLYVRGSGCDRRVRWSGSLAEVVG